MTRAAALVVCTLLASCIHAPVVDAGPVGGPNPAIYYPLAVGNHWRYSGQLLGEKVDREVTVVRREGATFIDDGGGRLAFDGEGLRDRDRYLLKMPLAPGATWTSVVNVQAIEHYRVAQMGVDCAAPAGAFRDCLVVQARTRIDAGSELVTEWTYAPEVGMVRLALTRELANGQKTPQGSLALASFEVKSCRLIGSSSPRRAIMRASEGGVSPGFDRALPAPPLGPTALPVSAVHAPIHSAQRGGRRPDLSTARVVDGNYRQLLSPR